MEYTDITYKRFEGFYFKTFKLNDVIIYDESGKEFIYNLNNAEVKLLTFKFETKRRLKKDFSKRESFIVKSGIDFSDKSTYNLYIPAEFVNFKFIEHWENVSETTGYLYKHDDYTFEGYIHEEKDYTSLTLKVFKLRLLKMEKTNRLIELEQLASEINACSYGLNITPYALEDILKKFDIIRKTDEYVSTSTRMSTTTLVTP